MERNIKNQIAPSPRQYDAYLYEWTVIENGKKYLGYHTGSVDDEYNHSSEDKEFQQIFDDPSYSFIFKVMEYGSTPEMRSREHQELSNVKAASNPMYYNKTNGSPANKCILPNTKKVEELYDEITTDAFPVVKKSIEYHTEMEFHQVRDSNDSDHQDAIRDRVNDNGLDKCDPIIVFEGFLPDNKDLRVDGNHTTWGIDRSKVKDKTKVKTMIIPSERTEGWIEAEVDLLGLMLNKQDMQYKSTSLDDTVRYVRRAVERGVGPRSPQLRRDLQKVGVTLHDINSAMNTVAVEVKNNQPISTANWIDWKSDPYTGKLKTKITNYTDDETCCMKMSSAAFRLGKLQEEMRAKDKKKMLVLLYHPNETSRKKWETNGLNNIVKTIEYAVRDELKITIQEIPYKADDARMNDFK